VFDDLVIRYDLIRFYKSFWNALARLRGHPLGGIVAAFL
jgi:hypothetical protein